MIVPPVLRSSGSTPEGSVVGGGYRVHRLGQAAGSDQADELAPVEFLIPGGEQGPDQEAHRLGQDVRWVEECHLQPSQDVVDGVGRSPGFPQEGRAAERARLVPVREHDGQRSPRQAVEQQCPPAGWYPRALHPDQRGDAQVVGGREPAFDRVRPPGRSAPRAAAATMAPRPPGP